jgi:hypothetical protein
VSKSFAEMKALVVNTNTGRAGHVLGWCIVTLVNVSYMKQPGDFKGGIGKGCNRSLGAQI